MFLNPINTKRNRIKTNEKYYLKHLFSVENCFYFLQHRAASMI